MDKVTQVHVIARAIHSLEVLRDNGIIENDDSTPTLFATHTWEELQLLKKALIEEAGIKARDIDLGAHMVFPK